MNDKTQKLKLWMRIGQPLEPVMYSYKSIFDAWEAGGVCGLVLGRMQFEGNIPAFTPNPEVYNTLGVLPPSPPEDELPEKRALLDKMLTEAKARGWQIFIFEAAWGIGRGGSGHIFADRVTQKAYCARIQDTLEHFPMVDGAIMDGPEWGYEIHPEHRSNIFNDLPDSVAEKAAELGYDYNALVAAKDRFYERLHNLRRSEIQLHAPGGLLGAFNLFGSDSDLMDWFRFRVEALTDFFRNVKTHFDGIDRKVNLGLGPRSACFAPLNGYDFAKLADVVDILLPKHYFWNRGVDGLYGTVARYIDALTNWNPDLTDADALLVVRALFGFSLPEITNRDDIEKEFPPEFFTEVVSLETRRALAVVDTPERIVPWVDAGQSPHGGDLINADALRQMLIAAQDAGLVIFLYHNHGHLTEDEWEVISEICGEAWRPGKSDYRPPGGRL
ncbi:hypothetical protein FJZ31_29035 [Candidatus Poribacteria bacterium]|nr:hypothetical protein [Candidatus Poribacteria bacterium]